MVKVEVVEHLFTMHANAGVLRKNCHALIKDSSASVEREPCSREVACCPQMDLYRQQSSTVH